MLNVCPSFLTSYKQKLSKRSVVACFFIFFSFLFFLVNYFFNFSDTSNLTSEKFSLLLVQLIFIYPLILWSVYEILRLFGKNEVLNKLVFAFASIIFLPIFFLSLIGLCQGNHSAYLKGHLLFVLGCAFLLLSLCLYFFPIAYRQSNKSFFKYLSNPKFVSLLKLSIFSLIFWNSLFFLVWTQKFVISATLFVLVILNDSLAYLFGSLFGKKRIFSSSPNKTLEGFISSLIIVPMFFSSCLLIDPYKNSFGMNSFLLIVMAIIFVFIANMGDLFFSKQKRIFGIKDYGRLFGNHGGFWDRFDSHAFVLGTATFIGYCLVFGK